MILIRQLALSTVYLFVSCSAYCVTVDWGPNNLGSTLESAKKLIRDRDPQLEIELNQAEREFGLLLSRTVIGYRLAVENRQDVEASFHPPVSPELMAEALSKLRFNDVYLDGCRICALPRPLYIGLAQRSAINFAKFGIVLFDHNQWRIETLRNKKLLALTELVRFIGIEGEDSRYRAANEILELTSGLQPEENLRTYNLNPANFSDSEEFDSGKIFLSFTTPGGESKSPQTEVFIANSKHPLFYGELCKEKSESRDIVDSAASRFFRGFNGVGLMDPLAVGLCQEIILHKKNIQIRTTFSSNTRFMSMCSPEFKR